MVLADRLRESLLCQVQPPDGPLDGGRTCILSEQGRWFGFSDGKMGRLGVTLHVGTWVNSQQRSALHPQPWSQWSSTDPRAVLTQKDEVFWKAETRQCVENPLRRLTRSLPALGAEPQEGGAQGPGSWLGVGEGRVPSTCSLSLQVLTCWIMHHPCRELNRIGDLFFKLGFVTVQENLEF